MFDMQHNIGPILNTQELKCEIVQQFKEIITPSFPQVYREWEYLLNQDDISISKSLINIINYLEKASNGNGISKKSIEFQIEFYVGEIYKQTLSHLHDDAERLNSIHQKKDTNHITEIRKKVTEDVSVINNENEDDFWHFFLSETMTLLDELMVDIFLEICNKWLSMKALKGEKEYIYFDCNDALNLKNASNVNEFSNKEFVDRERERFNIMKRVYSLGNIWIKERGNEIKVIKYENGVEEYDISTFSPMFMINGIREAYDKDTGERKGIYGVYIEPGSILKKLLIEVNKSKNDAHQLPLMMRDKKTSRSILDSGKLIEEIDILEKLQQELFQKQNKLGLNNRQAAHKMGVSPTTLYRFIKDPSAISERSVEKIKKWVEQNENI